MKEVHGFKLMRQHNESHEKTVFYLIGAKTYQTLDIPETFLRSVELKSEHTSLGALALGYVLTPYPDAISDFDIYLKLQGITILPAYGER